MYVVSHERIGNKDMAMMARGVVYIDPKCLFHLLLLDENFSRGTLIIPEGMVTGRGAGVPGR